MKIKLYLFIVVVSVIINYSCKGKETTPNQPDKTEKETSIFLNKDTTDSNKQSEIFPKETINFIEDALGNQIDVQALDSLQNTINEYIPPILEDFYRLKVQEQYKEALSIYEENKGDILVFLKTSTEKYQLHLEVLDLYYELYDDETALNQSISLLEFSEVMTDAVIGMSTNGYIPEHYGHLTYTLFSLYMEKKDWVKAQIQCDKMLNFDIEADGKEIHAYAIALFNQAMLYAETGKKNNALIKMKESKSVYELAGMKGTSEWDNCVDMIEEWLNE